MGRSIGKFVIQFGMVSIPADLYNVATASESKLGLNQLHGGPDGCQGRLNQVMVCKAHGDEPVVVDRANIVKGYEFAKDQYVLVTEADLESMPLASKNTLAITSFCDADQLDPSVFEKSYHLQPGKGGDKAFALLTKALQADGLVAIASITVRKKEQLCALRAKDDRLYVHPLFYTSEMQIEGPGKLADVSPQELEMARMLTQSLKADFDHEEHVDTYSQAFESMIARKLDPETKDAPPPVVAKPKDDTQDLAALLKASLGAVKAPKPPKEPAVAAKPRAKAKAR